MSFKNIYISCLIFLSINCFSQSNDIAVIPYPNEVLKLDGAFSITPFTKIIIQQRKNKSADELKWVAQYLDNHLFGSDTNTKKYNTIQSKMMRPQRIVLSVKNYFKEIGTEGYKLSVFPDVIIVSGNTPQGVFYGVQTLLQMAKPIKIAGVEFYYQVEGVAITDFPKFGWRGMHLDVSRHFFDVDFIKKYIDLLALHKMNTFHWHLVDDQGWRIEIKKYPKLTSIGAWRKDETHLDWYADSSYSSQKNTKKYGGFYSQEDIEEIVDYANKRFIKIVPEIEMPGHVQSALAAYPQYACSGKRTLVAPRGIANFSEPFCPTDSTFRFLEDILTEVFKLFPSEYIHVGGDEVNTTPWKSSKFVKDLMLQKGLTSYNEVQGYFMKRIERILTINGKKLIGWDEILENGLPSTSAIMCWRDEKIGTQALKENHPVVMSPSTHLYFDALNEEDNKYPNLPVTSLEKVYNYNPIPVGISYEESQRILGVQANLWTEYMQTPERVEQMAIPRICALSEVAWISPQKKDMKRFTENLPTFLKYLHKLDYYGFITKPKLEKPSTIFIDKMEIKFKTQPNSSTKVLYTLNDDDPIEKGKKYENPIEIDKKTILKAITVSDFGNSEILEVNFIKQDYKSDTKIVLTNTGINYTYFEGNFTKLQQLDTAKSMAKRTISQIKIPSYVPKDYWAAIFDGYIFIPEDDVYTFYLSADDGVSLYIDNEKLIEHDGIHGAVEKQNAMALKKGFHKIKCSYFENSGGESLSLFWESNKMQKQAILAELFFKE